MSVRKMTSCVLTAGLLVAVGCSRGPSRLHAPPIDASAAGVKAVEMYDTDKNGKISGAELDGCPALRAATAQIDADGDGAITAAEITARITAWQESKIGRRPVACTVLHHGQPLPEADVKCVPEKFLGETMQVASGKTDAGGMVMLSIPTSGSRDDPPGVPLGLYRVEITRAGAPIPPKYNSSTTLGHEVAADIKGMMFDLKY